MEEVATTAMPVLETAASVNWGFILSIVGALFAVVLGGMGSSIGIKTAGQKAAGVLAEKPNMFGSLVTMVVLPGSQGIYGLLIAIMILNKIGAMSGELVELTVGNGIAFLLAGLIIGILGLVSAMFQGRVVAAAIGGLARDESIFGGAITMSVLIETYAIFGLLISIFITGAALS
ncbi:V-type ATP synthase subunit K [bacterium]|jgi:V/A-type H+/Na+-transporting ATPase subunit K|nr:V-type ATP synthase subunit K [bacterium]MBT6831446.1 V-type ATP synthase subunit K [bacterium]MBT6996352.1 V-type ATP synthase subunit K [bacterium]MBT7772419.1 V-type ATP synthase subunit K [bacterium]